MATQGNDTLIVQRDNISGAGGDDTYVLSAAQIEANAEITISDTQGANTIQLIGGLSIASTVIASDTMQLTLSNGAVITILGASSFNYVTGGDPLTGTAGTTNNYGDFVTNILNETVPGENEDPINGGAVDIVDPNAPDNTAPVFSSAAADGENVELTYGEDLDPASVPAAGDFSVLVDGVAATVSSVSIAGDKVTLVVNPPIKSTDTLTVDYTQPATGGIQDAAGNSATSLAATSVTNNTQLTYTLTASTDAGAEGGDIVYTVTASEPLAADTNVTFNVVVGDTSAADQGTGTTNLNDFDQGAFNKTVVTIPAGSTTATYTVTPKVDSLTELPETFKVNAAVGTETFEIETTLNDGLSGGGKTETLTVNQDNLTGGSGDDIFNASAAQDGAGNLINTLQNVDVVNGGPGGVDTLNATLAQNLSVAPTLTNVDNVQIRFADGGAQMDLSNATGVKMVGVANSTTAGLVKNIGAATEIAVMNQNQDVNLDHLTSSTLAVNLDGFGTAAANKTLNLGATKAAAVTTANITVNNAFATIDSAQADVIETVTINATGTNKLSFVDSGAKITSATVTGSGSVDITATALTGALTKFDASASTGDVKADIQSTKAAVVTTGSGNDTIDMDTGGAIDSSVNLGAGDDTLLTGAKLANLNKGADGGAGTDIINITDGSKLDATNSKFITNFETLDVSGGTGDYDVSLNNFPTVQIDEAVNGALAGDINLKNAPDTFTFNLISKAGGGAFDVVKNTTVTLKDAAGTTAGGDAETFTLNATINDGDKDTTAEGINAQTFTVAGVETLNVKSTVASTDGATPDTSPAAHDLKVNFVAAQAETINITGDGGVDLSPVTTIGAVATVNATGSTGDITVNFSTHAKAVAYTGSAGVDTFTSGTAGTTIAGNKGADVIDLTAGATRDTVVIKTAADSQISKDTNSDNKLVLGTDTGFDSVTAFVAGGAVTADRFDVTNFSFTGTQRGVVDVSGKVAAATTDVTSITDLFADVAGDRGIAFTQDGTDTYVFVDANKDGNFTAADDAVVKLVGITAISEVDVNF